MPRSPACRCCGWCWRQRRPAASTSAVWYLPLADAMTFYLAGPIYVTALSALFLGEKVGRLSLGRGARRLRRRPDRARSVGRHARPGSLIALGGSLFYAVLMIVTRHLSDTSERRADGGAGARRASPSARSARRSRGRRSQRHRLPAASPSRRVSVVAIIFVNQSLRLAPASVVVPYQYTLIVWAIALRLLRLRRRAEAAHAVGAAIIVASGLFIFMREQRLKLPAPTRPRWRSANAGAGELQALHGSMESKKRRSLSHGPSR